MKTPFFIFTILFALMTVAGAIYVLFTGGQASAGFAVIPMLFTLVFLQAYRSTAKRNQE